MLYKLTKITIFLSLIIGAVASTDQQPRKELIYLGGWTKFPEEDTFDDSVVPVGNFFANSDYHKDIFFGGNSIRLNKLTEDSFQDTVHFFSEENYNRFEQRLLDQTEPFYGKFKEGDQVLIIVDNHGGPKSKHCKSGKTCADSEMIEEETHGGPYAINSPNAKDSSFSMDRTISVIKDLKERGIKVAIIDSSCYSGNSQVLANYGACVISTTGSNSLSYPEFKRVLFGKFLKGKNLEQVFLEARADSKSPSIPEISTLTGKKLSRNLTDMWIAPRLDTQEDLSDKIIQFTRPALIDRCDLLPKSSQYQISEALRTFLEINPDNSAKVRDLAKAIDQYDQKIIEITKQMQKELGSSAHNQEEFELKVYLDPMKPNYGIIQKSIATWDYITNLDRPEMKRAIEKMSDSLQRQQTNLKRFTNKDEIDAAQLSINRTKSWVEFYEKVSNRKRELEQNTDQSSLDYENTKRFREFAKIKAKYEDLINVEIYAQTKALIQKERAVYDELYKELRKDEGQSNACRDFKL
jgi:hypothetical protein